MPIGFSGNHPHKFAVAVQNKKIWIIWRNRRFVPSAKNHVPYNANHSRWKSFADAWVNLNSLKNFRGILTPLNYFSAHMHSCNTFRRSFSSAVVLHVLIKTIQNSSDSTLKKTRVPTQSIACSIDRIFRGRVRLKFYIDIRVKPLFLFTDRFYVLQVKLKLMLQ